MEDTSEIVKFFVENGVELDAQDSDGNTALMVAFQKAQISSTNILINADANYQIKNKNGKSVKDFYNEFLERERKKRKPKK